MDAKYCWNCGRALSPIDKFCSSCGKPVNTSSYSMNIEGNVGRDVSIVGGDQILYPASEVKQCPACGGNRIIKTALRCERCYGKGHIEQTVDHRVYYFVGCPECGGTRKPSSAYSIEFSISKIKNPKKGFGGFLSSLLDAGNDLMGGLVDASLALETLERAQKDAPYGNDLWTKDGLESSLDQKQVDEVLAWRKEKNLGNGWFISQSQCQTCAGKGEIRI